MFTLGDTASDMTNMLAALYSKEKQGARGADV